MISSKDAENCNDDHWSNGEHIIQGKTKRGQLVWPSKMQTERRRAISRTILAQDQMEITQPRTEFSLEVWHCLQCFSPTRVKARSCMTKPGPFARSPQKNLGTGSKRALTSWASVAHLQAPGLGSQQSPVMSYSHLQAARRAVPIISSKPGAWAWFLHCFTNNICSRGLKLALCNRIQVNNIFKNPQWNREETRKFPQDCQE